MYLFYLFIHFIFFIEKSTIESQGNWFFFVSFVYFFILFFYHVN